jgi:hypothetical protein
MSQMSLAALMVSRVPATEWRGMGAETIEPPKPKHWGPFGLGKWRGHPKVFCGICGWPQYILWVDDEEPPGTCPEGHTLARACPLVKDALMRNAFLRACTGKKEPSAPIEMLRLVTGWTWPEIEKMCDASGSASCTITEAREDSNG